MGISKAKEIRKTKRLIRFLEGIGFEVELKRQNFTKKATLGASETGKAQMEGLIIPSLECTGLL